MSEPPTNEIGMTEADSGEEMGSGLADPAKEWPVAETRLDIGLRKLRDYRGGAVLSDAEADAVLAERDALRAFVEQISWLDPQQGPVHVHTMVEHARRLLERSE